jgi:uncharacterized membrane-anchored protein YhcB (DUF1043 family)
MSGEDVSTQIARMDEGIKVRREQTERDIEALHAAIDQLRQDFKNELAAVKAELLSPLMTDVREVRDSMLYARGGWKVLIALGGLSAAVGALLGKIPWEKVFAKPWSN